MEAVDNAADRKEMRKILNLLGSRSIESVSRSRYASRKFLKPSEENPQTKSSS